MQIDLGGTVHLILELVLPFLIQHLGWQVTYMPQVEELIRVRIGVSFQFQGRKIAGGKPLPEAQVCWMAVSMSRDDVLFVNGERRL